MNATLRTPFQRLHHRDRFALALLRALAANGWTAGQCGSLIVATAGDARVSYRWTGVTWQRTR